MNQDSTTRFSNTVENYIRYRPGYPVELMDFMKAELGLKPNAVVADIGSGTGKLTELFLENGNPVFAVEPNKEMREAAERLYGHFPNFNSVNGTAETTNLPDHCADFVTAGQAFHWFGRDAARREFQQILKPGGWVLLIWNDRADGKSDFMRHYNEFLHDYSTDLESIDHRNITDEELKTFLGENSFLTRSFNNIVPHDYSGVKGRYLSCSYALHKKHPRHEDAMNALNATFEAHAENGKIDMWYLTKVYSGKLI